MAADENVRRSGAEQVALRPVLDPGFEPAVRWQARYEREVALAPDSVPVALALTRPDGAVSVVETRLLNVDPARHGATGRYLERLVKFLLWQRGGSRVVLCGSVAGADYLRGIYGPEGARAFDADVMGTRIFGEPFTVEARPYEERPVAREAELALGGHLEGCRLGFDLGGSDRKCAAVRDGKVLFAEEIRWDPYFQADPAYHRDGINDSLRRAAAHLPRVDAIGGSAAGVYVNNQVRIASLFRGVPAERFTAEVQSLFIELQREWNVPLEVVNDGEVTALAGAQEVGEGALLGIALGTSCAAGYCNPAGNLTNWLNELAFVPVDYRPDGPQDEWSGDVGCGVQYFSQQAVARLAPAAGFSFEAEMPFADRLLAVQRAMEQDDPRARRIYETIGSYLGWTLPLFARFYDLRHALLLGRVMSGPGGEVLLATARQVLAAEFPELAGRLQLHQPGESLKRHGQAIAAASLPAVR
ncbi:MAG: ROK family protein [Candidatus Marinimicrobia bacterium]|nr:ROK family protein [Candidatus Neomarinimicrobiota bacterium]